MKDFPGFQEMWICLYCLSVLTGVKLTDYTNSQEDKFLKLEERVDNLERKPAKVDSIKAYETDVSTD